MCLTSRNVNAKKSLQTAWLVFLYGLIHELIIECTKVNCFLNTQDVIVRL